MGDRPHILEVCQKTGSRPVWRSMGGALEQHHAGRGQDSKIRNYGPEGLLGRSSDHEETKTHQADSTVRRVHVGGTYLHHHGTDETRFLAGLLAGYVCFIILLRMLYPGVLP